MRFLISLSLLALAACQGPATQQGPEGYAATSFTEVMGAEVAVLEVANSTRAAMVPSEDLRSALRTHLLDLGFTPLSKSYVNSYAQAERNLANLRIPGASTLSVQVLHWDERHVLDQGRFDVQVAVVVRGADGLELYRSAGRLRLTVAPGDWGSSGGMKPNGGFLDELAKEILVDFPSPEPL